MHADLFLHFEFGESNGLFAFGTSHADVPLFEDTERYEADIVSGTTVKRTISTTQPTLTYRAADQQSDFTTLPGSITLTLAQISASYGRGAPLTATV